MCYLSTAMEWNKNMNRGGIVNCEWRGVVGGGEALVSSIS